MSFWVYFLKNKDGKLYIGQTDNLERRMREHAEELNLAAKFSRDFRGFNLVFKEEYKSRLEAMRREKQLKGWSRAKKEALVRITYRRVKNFRHILTR